MPTQKTKKPIKVKQYRWRNRATFLGIAILALLFVGIGLEVYSQAQYRKSIEVEKAQFEALDKDILATADRIKAEVMPEKDSFKKECTTQSRDYEEEPIVCSINWSAIFYVSEVKDANEIHASVSNALKDPVSNFKFINNVQMADGNDQIQFMELPREESAKKIGSELYVNTSSELTCSVSYELERVAPSDDSSKNLKRSFTVSTDCGTGTKTEVYPLKT